MLDLFKSAVAAQFEAAYCTLDKCIDQCSDTQWQSPVVHGRFCQVVFHALFFSDVYLGPNLKSLHEQEFHQQNPEVFGDYEELEDRVPTMIYSKADVKKYLQHCREKAKQVIAGETKTALGKSPGFDWLEFSRAEVHIYNLRHLHHHAAQLSMRLRIDTGQGVPWIKSGWID